MKLKKDMENYIMDYPMHSHLTYHLFFKNHEVVSDTLIRYSVDLNSVGNPSNPLTII